MDMEKEVNSACAYPVCACAFDRGYHPAVVLYFLKDLVLASSFFYGNKLQSMSKSFQCYIQIFFSLLVFTFYVWSLLL